MKKTHDLGALTASLTPHHSSLRGLRRGLLFLSDFAVTPRYPGEDATKRQASAALRWMRRVRGVVRGLLGIGQHDDKKSTEP